MNQLFLAPRSPAPLRFRLRPWAGRSGMSDVFISYARSTATQAQAVGEALRSLGYGVWRDDELPAHRSYAEVIEERLKAAKAVVVIWSAEAVKSEWVQSEADRARMDRKLVQVRIDAAALPMPFDRIQCADLTGWTGNLQAHDWRKVVASVADLVAGATGEPAAVAPAPPLALPAKPSIAVMPFVNVSGDAEQEYFADGMLLEIVEALSRIKSIFVVASGSSLSFKGKGVAPQEAARQLGVRYILEGSIRKAGGRVRIGVQLIDAADGVQIWTHRFEDTLDDVFALQDAVAMAVAGKIEPTVEQVEIRRAAARPTHNINSHDLYLRALPVFRAHSKAGTLEALDLLNQAIALDPANGPALALAVSCHRTIAVYGWSDDPEEHRRQGVILAGRAVKAAADDATVLASVANDLPALERRVDVALPLAKRAVAMNPGSASVWFNSGCVRLMAGETDIAIEHFETAMRLDPAGPNRPIHLLFLALAHLFAHRFAEAIALVRERNQYSESPGGYAILAASHGHLGQPGPGQEALTRYRVLTPMPMESFVQLFIDPAQRKLILDGVALAQDESPPDAAAKSE
jgi:adenylate cyclase